MKKYFLAVLASGIWINISEFVRNELVIKKLWINGFQEKGLAFPTAPLNGVVWVLWAFIFASILALLCTRFNALSSAFISWVTGFVLLWVAMWNMNILPPEIISWAVPWSFFEVYIAAYFCTKVLKY